MIQHTEIDIQEGSRIIFPKDLLHSLYEHCRRKLTENYLDQESRERKAFGLIAGSHEGRDLAVTQCLPLMNNARQLEPYKEFMDGIMTQHATPSETPLSKRGWVADPEELLEKTRKIQEANLLLLGTYHMHRVAWPEDPLRDRPTTLDTILGAESNMLMFIISMVKSDEPLIRAFYEGKPDKEIPIVVRDFTK